MASRRIDPSGEIFLSPASHLGFVAIAARGVANPFHGGKGDTTAALCPSFRYMLWPARKTRRARVWSMARIERLPAVWRGATGSVSHCRSRSALVGNNGWGQLGDGTVHSRSTATCASGSVGPAEGSVKSSSSPGESATRRRSAAGPSARIECPWCAPSPTPPCRSSPRPPLHAANRAEG